MGETEQKGNMIETKATQEITEPKKGFTRTEVNFLQYPFGSLDKNYKGNSVTYSDTIPTEKGNISLEWMVSGNSTFGLPGPTAIGLDNALGKLFQDRKINGQIPKWIKIPYYELAKNIGKTNNGRTNKIIKRDLRKLGTSSIVSKRAFYQKGKKEWGELIFQKYQAIALKGESLPPDIPETEGDEKGNAEMVYVLLGDIYYESLKNHYTKQIDYDFMMGLGNATLQRIYQLLSLGFQTRMIKDKDDKECLNYNYIEFSNRLPIKVWDEKKQAKLHLKRYLTKFVENNYLQSFAFEFERTQDRWYVRFYPGQKALQELETISGQQTLFDHIESEVKEIEHQENKSRIEVLNKSRQEEETKYARQERERLKREDEERQNSLNKLEKLPIAQKEILEQQARIFAKSKGGIVTRLSIEIELENLVKEKLRSATIVYKDEAAQDVKVAGEWNHWNEEPMEKIEGGKWTSNLELMAGEYKYKLIVDGQWKTNPDGELASDLQKNNRISI